MDIEKQAVTLKSFSDDAETISILLKKLSNDEYNRKKLLVSMTADEKTISILLKNLTANEFRLESLLRSHQLIIKILNRMSSETVQTKKLHELCGRVFAGEIEKTVRNMNNYTAPPQKPQESPPKKRKSSPKKRKSSPKKQKSSPKNRKNSEKKTQNPPKMKKTGEKRKVLEKKIQNSPKIVKKRKKSRAINECCLRAEQISRICEDINNECTHIFETTKTKKHSVISNAIDITVLTTESWKNVYYTNYIIGEEIANIKKGSNGVVQIYFDDRSQQLILGCCYERKGIYTNLFTILSDNDSIQKMNIPKDVKNGLIVMFQLIKEKELVRELCDQNDAFGIKDKIIQMHDE